MEIIVFIGIPGSGKSSFYKEKFFDTHLRVNLDMLHTRNKEIKLIEYCIRYGQPAVIDNTNVTAGERKKYIEVAKANNLKTTGFYFQSDLKPCLARNERRTGPAKVKTVGVIAKYKKLQKPEPAEGFDRLYHVSINREGFFEVNPYP